MSRNLLLKIFSSLLSKLFAWASVSQRVNILSELTSVLSKSLPPDDALKVLLDLDNRLYYKTGKAAQRYGNNVHPKQRLINYKDFFIKNINPGEKVLDIACGNGYLSFSVADAVPGVSVTGFDISTENLAVAAKLNSRVNINYTLGNVYEYRFENKYDVVIMSAILEHLENRVALLNKLTSATSCRVLLIRVPAFDRDWRVPLKSELGLEYRLDHTHCLEYTEEKLVEELTSADMKLDKLYVRWGEIYAAFVPG